MSGYFITGTDTGVGKTMIANALLRLAAERGQSTLGLKPVAAGCYLRDGMQVNEDAWELLQSSSITGDYPVVNPAALREPMAPHIAADRENVQLQAQALARHCQAYLTAADFCVVEGAGGWMVPINANETMVDIARTLQLDVILVVGLRLGCINHALLTADAIKNAGLHLAGWVANHIDPDMAVMEENYAALVERIAAPALGRVPWLPTANPVFAAPYLDSGKLG